ncbi:MAG TPA: hypothetical protein PLD62_03305 [Candidatus Cloacimonadota bacterium]|nr:hypothetical protein [Candidatus Cloacimonadota bacterium]
MKTTINEILSIIEGNLLTANAVEETIEFSGGYVSDLLSDVMGNAREHQIWITIMRHLNVIAVASLANLSAVVFAKNVLPDQAVIQKANEEGICLINSSLSTFELTGRLYVLLNSKK